MSRQRAGGGEEDGKKRGALARLFHKNEQSKNSAGTWDVM